MIGVVMDGVPAGIVLSVSDFEADLARRRPGCGGCDPSGIGKSARNERDIPEMVSGVLDSRPACGSLQNGQDRDTGIGAFSGGVTTGAPLTVIFRNEDARSADYLLSAAHPRPSQADLVAARKFGGHNDLRGGGHFSGRLTLCLVAAGVVARKMLADRGLNIVSEIVELGGSRDKTAFGSILEAARNDGDSVGAVIECRAKGVAHGLGEPFFDSFEGVLSHILFAIPGVRGVEFGAGFAGAAMRGSEHNDAIVDRSGDTATNNSGGVNGGVTNGNEIVFRVAMKPTASIAKPQRTYNFGTQSIETLQIKGRHDVCIALRAAVVVEAALAIVLADFTGDSQLAGVACH